MPWIYELEQWPDFTFQAENIAQKLAYVRNKQGRLIGRMEALGFNLAQEATLSTITSDVIKSSAIEGEQLNKQEVRSSIARRLGIDIGGLIPASRDVEGIVEVMLDATQQYHKPLTEDRLFAWHAALFPTGRSGMHRITVGDWRLDKEGPMQVVSGPIGREKIHYEAIPAKQLDAEMTRFLNWFNDKLSMDPVIKAAIAHFWFVTIHPFDDGNGRLARAIADMALARADQSVIRCYSMSTQIEAERKDYYSILERQQRSTTDVTPWLEWFLGCLERSLEGAVGTLSGVLEKSAFWERANQHPLNERQQKVLERLLDDFKGNLNTSKYANIAKTSHDTALRDIKQLLEYGLLEQNDGGGRSTSYSLELST